MCQDQSIIYSPSHNPLALHAQASVMNVHTEANAHSADWLMSVFVNYTIFVQQHILSVQVFQIYSLSKSGTLKELNLSNSDLTWSELIGKFSLKNIYTSLLYMYWYLKNKFFSLVLSSPCDFLQFPLLIPSKFCCNK